MLSGSAVLTLDGSPAPGCGVGPDVDALDVVNAQVQRVHHRPRLQARRLVVGRQLHITHAPATVNRRSHEIFFIVFSI